MNRLKQLKSRLAALFRKRELDLDMDAEMRSHIEMRTQQNIEAGMNPEEARFAALRRFGWTESIKEDCRAQRGVRWLENLVQDIRFGARQLSKNPGFTAATVPTLALGIGACTAIFSLCDAVLLKPLPYPNPEQLVILTDLHEKGYIRATSFPNFVDWHAQNTALKEIAAMSSAAYNLASEWEPERVQGQRVTFGFFPLLGVPPLLGRWFTSEEDRANAERVAIISYNLWQRRFSGDRAIVGKPVTLDGNACTIVGVMPPHFSAIAGNRFLSVDNTRDIWVPLAADPAPNQRGAVFLRVIGRLNPGVSIEAATAELNTIASRLAEQFPNENAGFGIQVHGMHTELVENVRSTIWLLVGAVALLLLIACANVANLFLVRAVGRAGEMTIRAAVGASRGRIIRQMLTEGTVVAASGGLLGIGLGWLGVASLQRFLPSGQIPVQAARVNLAALGFVASISLAAGLLFALAPALHSAKVNLNDALKSLNRGAGGGGPGRLRHLLIVFEVALAFVLLTSAGLVIRSLGQLLKVNPGFRAKDVLTMSIHLPEARYGETSKVTAFYDQLLARVGAMPGVESVGAVRSLPMSGSISTTDFSIDGSKPQEGNPKDYTDLQSATTGYFELMKIPLLKGRLLNEQDRADTPGVVVINQQMASRFWPSNDAVGHSILLRGKPYEIVGIVGNVRHYGLAAAVRPETYLAHSQQADRAMMLGVRANVMPTTLARDIRREIARLDATLPVSGIRTLEAAVNATTSDQRGVLVLLGVFGVAAAILSGLGLYGVIADSVAQRQRDIGIRLALGAQRADVRRLVLRQGMTLAGIGVGIGLLGALAATQLLRSLLFGVSPTDPATFLAVPALLLAVAWFACWLPARRAAQVEPMVALRTG